MMRVPTKPSGLLASIKRACGNDRASQIVEAALSLPLLVMFAIGIFDFSSALSLKQKLTNAAREGARVAASDPATDLNASLPVSVSDAFQVVDNYLLSAKVNDCGLSTPAPTQTGLMWNSTTTGTCPGSGITVSVNRGCTSTITANATTVHLIGTCVLISYPYSWQYGGVAGLFGGSFTGPSTINTAAGAFNEN
ncbi:MAG TPA: TadE family protein [Candidatus Dormibacteraeota bacterium]|jgi:Flp pilus assembly protein TadG|nr:TadE family protein [Candidatus Dormibacteraeota bacterium]